MRKVGDLVEASTARASRPGAPKMDCQHATNDEFASLALAREYIDSVRAGIDALPKGALIDALLRVEGAYFKFPELLFERPRKDLIERLCAAKRITGGSDAALRLLYCVVMQPPGGSCTTSLYKEVDETESWTSVLSIVRLLSRSRRVRWNAIKPLLEFLRQRDRREVIYQVIAFFADQLELCGEADASEFGSLLLYLLNAPEPLGIDSAAFATNVLAACRRLGKAPQSSAKQASRQALLELAERCRTVIAAPPLIANVDLAWPSGRMSLQEFLLQWPCEIQLPTGLEDAELIRKAYRSILLRAPEPAEIEQYLRLRRDGVSTLWIVEDLVASEELRRLGRRLRVVMGANVITEPGRSEDEKMPTVTWLGEHAIAAASERDSGMPALAPVVETE